MPQPRVGGLFLPGIMPSARIDRYSSPLEEELYRRARERLQTGEYAPRVPLAMPTRRDIDLSGLTEAPQRALNTAAIALAEEPQTMPLPGTLAYQDVLERKRAGQEMSKEANDRRLGVPTMAGTPPTTPAAIPPEVAQFAADRNAAPAEERQPFPGGVPVMEAMQALQDAQQRNELGREEDRQKALERSKNILGLAQGLELAGRSLGGMRGTPMIPQPLGVTGGLQQEVAEKEDVVPLQTRRMLGKYGIKVPEGARMSQLQAILPGVIRLNEGEIERQTAERERQLQTIEQGGEKKKDLSDKELAQLEEMDSAIRGFKDILEERKRKGYFTGPLDRVMAWAGEKTGTISAESAEWRRKVMSRLNNYIRAMTGAQLSKAEAERLTKALPTEGDQEYIFDAKAEGVIQELEEKRRTFLKTRSWGGKRTEPFEKVVAESGGEEYAVPSGDLREFMNAR